MRNQESSRARLATTQPYRASTLSHEITPPLPPFETAVAAISCFPRGFAPTFPLSPPSGSRGPGVPAEPSPERQFGPGPIGAPSRTTPPPPRPHNHSFQRSRPPLQSQQLCNASIRESVFDSSLIPCNPIPNTRQDKQEGQGRGGSARQLKSAMRAAGQSDPVTFGKTSRLSLTLSCLHVARSRISPVLHRPSSAQGARVRRSKS
jgi:hypothetical protein